VYDYVSDFIVVVFVCELYCLGVDELLFLYLVWFDDVLVFDLCWVVFVYDEVVWELFVFGGLG